MCREGGTRRGVDGRVRMVTILWCVQGLGEGEDVEGGIGGGGRGEVG